MELATVRKTVVSVIFLIGAALALILNNYDPSFTQAVVALAGAVISAVAVFATKNSSPDDWSKAAAQVQAAALFVAGYFTTIPTSTTERITLLVGAALSALAVFWVRNDSPTV